MHTPPYTQEELNEIQRLGVHIDPRPFRYKIQVDYSSADVSNYYRDWEEVQAAIDLFNDEDAPEYERLTVHVLW